MSGLRALCAVRTRTELLDGKGAFDKVIDDGLSIADFLRERTFPGTVLFAKVWGSHSHGTQTPASDVDYLAVYQAPTAQLLSLTPPPETVDGQKPDFQAHEVAKFCHLLLKGNPGVLEMLFTDRMCYTTGPWDALRAERRRFLTRQAVSQYLGYCEGQMKKLFGNRGLHTKGGAYNEKGAYHMIRLLADAERIAGGGEPVVWKEGEELALLMKIRSGQIPQSQIERMALDGLARIEGLKPWKLPEEGDRDFLQQWLLKLRGV